MNLGRWAHLVFCAVFLCLVVAGVATGSIGTAVGVAAVGVVVLLPMGYIVWDKS